MSIDQVSLDFFSFLLLFSSFLNFLSDSVWRLSSLDFLVPLLAVLSFFIYSFFFIFGLRQTVTLSRREPR